MAAYASRKLDCQDLHSYLKTLPHNVLDGLYNHPATCFAVFRELPELSKNYVMRVLFVEQAVSQPIINQWIKDKQREKHNQAVKALSSLRIWQSQPLPGGMAGWILNETFQQNLKIVLLGGGQTWTGGGMLPPDRHAKDIVFLDKYSQDRWECVLHFMVESAEGIEGVSADIISVLLNSGLMKEEEGETRPMITPSGFQFLLMETSSQIWYFMLQYLETVQTRKMNLVECLSFLFQLSFSTLGKDYSTDGMSDSQLKFLQHLREFGLVYQRKRKEQRYYPTRLAINLASGLSSSASVATSADAEHPGFLIVETNYRVYAFTDSPLRVALLALFCEMIYRFPNFAVANLTRQSVRAALSRGISADQILNFLKSHAHPEMMKKTPVIPPTVTDQIRLWELERDRFQFTDGVLYSQFLSQTDFTTLRDYAKEMAVLVWENPSRRVMVVTRAGHDDVKKFWKRQRKDNS